MSSSERNKSSYTYILKPTFSHCLQDNELALQVNEVEKKQSEDESYAKRGRENSIEQAQCFHNDNDSEIYTKIF